MWWMWPHLRRVWAAAGTVTAGLLVTYLYSMSSRQPLPDQRLVANFLNSYWQWLSGALLVLAVVSVFAERAYRQYQTRAPRPLRMKPHGWRRPLGRKPSPSLAASSGTAIVVGREAELARLNAWLAQVQTGRRRVVFVAGEPGIGKSTIVNAFLASLARDHTLSVGRGHCVEQYGAGEPYMPILEALTRMCREPGGERLLAILHRLAPAWLAQMPSLVSAEDRLRLQGQSQGVTQQRMLREMAEALEAITAESALVLLLEDLHWSDYSTLDLIGAIARRTEPAQLMILGTYRPVEMLAGEHPLRAMKAELEVHHQCEELRLKLLSESDVAAYLQQRFANDIDFGVPQSGAQLADSTSPLTPLLNGEGNQRKKFGILRRVYPERSRRTQNDKQEASVENESFLNQHQDLAVSFRSEQALRAAEGSAERGIPDSTILAPTVYARSEGNPLFMVNVVDYLVAQGPDFDASKLEAPHNLRQMIERNLERLTPDEQSMLEAASVAGAEFSAATVAAALDRPISEIEASCTKLARREQFVGAKEPIAWPDGTIATGFRFHHALYQETLYGRLPAAHRVDLHRRIAQREESAYGERAAEIAAELAYHFDRCADSPKAIKYMEMAGARAVDRRAYTEAEQHYRNALALLQNLPESSDRDKHELKLQVAFGRVMQWTHGWSADQTVEAYSRARLVAERSGSAASINILAGLCSGAILRGETRVALALADQMLDVARGIGEHAGLGTALSAQGYIHYLLGDLVAAREYLLEALDHYRERDARSPRLFGDPLIFAGLNEWHLGYPDKALGYMDDAVSRARRGKDPAAIGFSLWFSGNIHAYRGEFNRTRQLCDEAIELGAAAGFALLCAIAKINIAWAQAHMGNATGAIDRIREGLAELDVIRFFSSRPKYLGYLCETQTLAGEIDDALVTVEQALQSNPEELIHRPYVLRLRGELRLRKNQIELAEQEFREATRLARQMSARSPELRATTSLARLLRDTGRRDEARARLTPIYNWFTEGFDTADLKDAKKLLDELTPDRISSSES